MGTNTQSDADSSDTNTRIDPMSPAADRPADTAASVTSILATNNGSSEQSRCFIADSERISDDHDGFVAEVTTIAQSWCERATSYVDIENGFKKQKLFMVRTTSTEGNYRFFNFAFACVLYNVWRLVDLLVKLAIDGEHNSYAPRVDANLFLTVAKQYYGPDPPD